MGLELEGVGRLVEGDPCPERVEGDVEGLRRQVVAQINTWPPSPPTVSV